MILYYCIIVLFDLENSKIKLIIGTIDSFVYALGNRYYTGVDKFIKMAQSIIQGELTCSEKVILNMRRAIRLYLVIIDLLSSLSGFY
jgi:hypothetical protein